MAKVIMILVAAILLSCVNIAGAVSGDILVTENGIEPNQTTGAKCMVGALYLETLCLVANGNPAKCLNMSSIIYGLPCLIFDGIYGDDEISMQKCLIGYFYTATGCLACEGDVLRCLGLASSTYFLPCMYRALNNETDPPDSTP